MISGWWLFLAYGLGVLMGLLDKDGLRGQRKKGVRRWDDKEWDMYK